MALIGFVCPPGSDEPGRRNDVSFCTQQCTNPCVLPPLTASIYAAERGNYHQGAYISASMIASGGCPKQTWLERRVDYYDTIRRRFWAFRGNIVHHMIEKAPVELIGNRWVQELSMHTMLDFPDEPAPLFDENGVFTGEFDHSDFLRLRLNGTCDAYDVPNRTLWDVKTTGDFKMDQFIDGKDFGDGIVRNIDPIHIMQMQVYCYLLSKTPMPDAVADQLGVPRGTLMPKPEQIIIQKIGMMDLARSGYDHLVKRKGKKSLLPIEHCPVYENDDIEAWIRPRALDWYKWLVLGEEPPVVPKKDQWLCYGCSFKDVECHPDVERAKGNIYKQRE